MARWTVLALLLATATAQAGPKDPKTAKILSAAGAAGAGLVVFGGFMFAEDSKPFNTPVLYTGLGLLFVTPSLGQFYSEQFLTIGMGIRAAAAGLAVYTLQTQTKEVTCQDALSSDEKCTGFKEYAYPMLGIAGIIFIGGVWWDGLDAADSARRYNEKHGFSITPAPTVMRGPQGLAPGLSLSGTF